LILKRKQRWGLSLPLINREQNYRLKNEILLLKRKVKTGIAKKKKKEKRSLKLKTKEEREEREEPKLEPWCCYIVFPAPKLTNLF
jgi:hypothetical protein